MFGVWRVFGELRNQTDRKKVWFGVPLETYIVDPFMSGKKPNKNETPEQKAEREAKFAHIKCYNCQKFGHYANSGYCELPDMRKVNNKLKSIGTRAHATTVFRNATERKSREREKIK